MIAASSVETEALAKMPLVKCFRGFLSNMLLVVRLSFQKGKQKNKRIHLCKSTVETFIQEAVIKWKRCPEVRGTA